MTSASGVGEVSKQQTHHHLFTKCQAWLPQIRKLWKDIGKAHGVEAPKGPLRQVAVEGEVHGGNACFPEEHLGTVH